MVIQHCEFTKSPWIVHFKMVKMVDFMLSEFYLNWKKKKKEGPGTKSVKPWNKCQVSPVLGNRGLIVSWSVLRGAPGAGDRAWEEGGWIPVLERGRWRISGSGLVSLRGVQNVLIHLSLATAPCSSAPIWLFFLTLDYILVTKSREHSLKCIGVMSHSPASALLCLGWNPA